MSAARGSLTLALARAALAALVSWLARTSPQAEPVATPAAAPGPTAAAPRLAVPEPDAAARVPAAERAQALPVPEGGLPPVPPQDLAWIASSVVRGRVLLDGREVAGADIDLRQEGGDGVRGLKAWEPIVADAHGRFEVRFDADATAGLRARSGLAESEWVSVHTAPGSQDDVVLKLVQPFLLRGRVLEPDGSPADDALVHAVTVTPGGDHVELDQFGVPTTLTATDAEGGFTLRITSANRYRAVAEAPGRMVAESGDVTLNDAARDVSVTLRLAPRPGGN